MATLKQSDEISEYCPNQYGYGTQIVLSCDQCEALGISSSVKAGQPVSIRASGIVTSATEEIENDPDSTGKDISITIQLTDMTISMNGTANAAKAANMLYGKDED